MKRFLSGLVLILLMLNCKNDFSIKSETDEHLTNVSIIIPDIQIDKSDIIFQKSTSLWLYNKEPFSGYVIEQYANNNKKQKFGVYHGKKHGKSEQWFENGLLRKFEEYKSGKLNGEKKTWIADSSHRLISHLNYKAGKAHGVQKKWYVTGEIFKILNLNNGKEEGMQRAYRKNGDLFANYEAKDGRIYGLKKTALCFELNDEAIQYEE